MVELQNAAIAACLATPRYHLHYESDVLLRGKGRLSDRSCGVCLVCLIVW